MLSVNLNNKAAVTNQLQASDFLSVPRRRLKICVVEPLRPPTFMSDRASSLRDKRSVVDRGNVLVMLAVCPDTLDQIEISTALLDGLFYRRS